MRVRVHPPSPDHAVRSLPPNVKKPYFQGYRDLRPKSNHWICSNRLHLISPSRRRGRRRRCDDAQPSRPRYSPGRASFAMNSVPLVPPTSVHGTRYLPTSREVLHWWHPVRPHQPREEGNAGLRSGGRTGLEAACAKGGWPSPLAWTSSSRFAPGGRCSMAETRPLDLGPPSVRRKAPQEASALRAKPALRPPADSQEFTTASSPHSRVLQKDRGRWVKDRPLGRSSPCHVAAARSAADGHCPGSAQHW